MKEPISNTPRGRWRASNPGASAAHVSENGARSFGDRYARNLAATPEVIPAVPADSPEEKLDAAWTVAGFSFDNQRNTVTAYFNGKATEFWIENPEKHPFFQWPHRGWVQAQLRRIPGLQPGEDPGFPAVHRSSCTTSSSPGCK